MATQTTEVSEENSMNLEAASANAASTVGDVETLCTTASFAIDTKTTTTAQATTETASFATVENNKDENEKNALKEELMTVAVKEKELLIISSCTTDVTVIPDADTITTSSKDKTSLSIEKKFIMSDEQHQHHYHQEQKSDANTSEENLSIASTASGNSYNEGNGGTGLKSSGCNIHDGSNSNLASGDYCDNNIPEWKKELLQRRKTKIARTIGANQINNNLISTKKDSTSPITPLTKTLTNSNNSNNISNNSSKNSSHQIISKILPTTIIATNTTHQTTISGAGRTHLGCSTGHYTTVNSSQSYAHQPQQICVTGMLYANTSLETKSTSLLSSSSLSSSSSSLLSPSQSLPTAISTSSSSSSTSSVNSTFKSDGFNGGSSSNSDLNNSQSSNLLCTENNLKCNSNIINNTSCGSGSNNGSNSNNSSVTCRITLQSKKQLQQQQNQLEQLDSISNTGGSSQEQQQQPFQLHSKHDIVKTSSIVSPSCSTVSTTSASLSNNINNSNNISFIKNPSVGKTSINKANKYKLSAKLNSNTLNVGSVITVNTTNSQTKKMVAMQQMDINESSVNANLDFDPSEELQYGPGIVSKLRCRYLSLALRQSVGKQRPPLDNLRRATSLNNLLDDDDDSNNGSVVDHVDNIENNTTRNNSLNTDSASATTTPDEFVANFQKNLKMSDKDKQRSRQLKRGNDSLKRARSVEALLGCDKSWDHINNIGNGNENNGEKTQIRTLYHRMDGSGNNSFEMCSISSAADVTIEDKIIHARERIACEKTPKRLTSIIDDTERPPPDVVKQTLKIFEATANRRGRGLSRNNCSGEVAAKVANYKSIISQEKPPIVFPKPPLSPKRQFKKPNSLDITSAKRNLTSNNAANITTKKINPASPISSLAKKFTNPDAFNESSYEKSSITSTQSAPSHYQQNQQHTGGIISPLPIASGGHRAEMTLRHHRQNFMAKNESTPIRSSFDSNSNSNSPSRTPDLIPRKHFEQSLFAESLSPVTQLAKNIEKLRIESPTQQSIQSSSITQPNILSSVAVSGSINPPQRQNSETNNDSSDVSDVEELIKQVSKTTVSKSTLYKEEKIKENSLNKSSSSSSSFNISSSNKPLSLPTAVNGNSLAATTSSCTSSIEPQQQQQQQQQGQHQQQIMPTKQVCVIRPLLAETSKISQQQTEKLNSSLDKSEKSVEKLDLSVTDALNANKTRDNLVISSIGQSGICSTLNSSDSSNEQLQQQQQQQKPALTSREIEKNLINEKKTEQAAIEASASGAKWPFMKKKSSWSQQMAEAQNNSMVFNFKDRKEVPDYIENDGLFVKRRRELPKPNEPGFVLLGDLSLETSTDPDDSWTMGPPSPCDVEFENANVIIDGKSSIRYKTRDSSLKVQFDDTLTSTFEYPSESSLLEDIPTFETENTEMTTTTTTATKQITKIDEIIKAPGQKSLGNMSLDYRNGPLSTILPQSTKLPPPPPLPPNRLKFNTNFPTTTTRNFSGDSGSISTLPITPLSPPSPPTTTAANNFVLKPPKRIKPLLLLPTVPVGSAPLGSYTPIKAQINTQFELGITRVPTTMDDCCTSQNNINSIIMTTNGNNSYDNNILMMTTTTTSGTSSTTTKMNNCTSSIQQNGGCSNNDLMINNKNNEPESLPYLKPATDDLTIVYSEGSQKTDLLY